VEISDYKKSLTEADDRYRQQRYLFEAVRAERNLYSKSLTEAQEEIQDLKRKLKLTTHQVEQLKEDIATKETRLIKEEFRKLFRSDALRSPGSAMYGLISRFLVELGI